MFISIRKIFLKLKISFVILLLGIGVITLQIIHLSQFSERLNALKNQHLVIDKMVNTDLNDPKMASILLNNAIAEMNLYVKLSAKKSILDSLFYSTEEQDSLYKSLQTSSGTFNDSVLLWSESLPISKESGYSRMMHSRELLLRDIDRMIDYQIHAQNNSITIATMSAYALFSFGIILLFLYRGRLNLIYADITQACALDTDGSKKEVKTEEIDFILKRLARKNVQVPLNPTQINPLSGLNNDKGLIHSFNMKKTAKSGNTLFLCLLEIDQYNELVKTYSNEEIGSIFKKLGDMIAMYEQPLDVIAHLESNRLVFLLSRSSKEIALSECEKIVQSAEEMSINTTNGPLKITLSGGFILKTPAKSIEEAVIDAYKLVVKAKESGGNRIAQLRERTTTYR
ncbi:MAG: diguanylate cyclase [Sulfuricurvum sp.]|nr:diguanylate cyclase [Sulfuricurvum sp.]